MKIDQNHLFQISKDSIKIVAESIYVVDFYILIYAKVILEQHKSNGYSPKQNEISFKIQKWLKIPKVFSFSKLFSQ